MNRRLSELDMAKGTAMLLVVIGHIVSRDHFAPGAEWYMDLRALIYLFHMPLFMALSGMALGASWQHRSDTNLIPPFIWKRVKTLMTPFIIFGIVIVAGKIIASRWTTIDNPPVNFTQGISSILMTPMASPAGFLWYIQVLAIYFVFAPWVLQFSEKWGPWVMLLLGVILQGHGWPTFLNIDYCIEYLPFFSLGILLGQHWAWIKSTLFQPKTWALWFIPFAAALVYSELETPLQKWLVGALSIPFVLTVHQSIVGRLKTGLTFIGNYTLSIYLMNTIFIGLAKAVLTTVVPWRDNYFYIHFVVLGMAGIFLPIFTKKVLVRMWSGFGGYI
jgi:fucose 4-O-acetylase-like acetyltransferase